MAIPESQFNTWANQGSVTQSKNTYATVKAVLESSNAPYAKRGFSVFLQGSYGNDTNIYSESDVDIVIQLTSAFIFDLDALPEQQKSAFHHAHSGTITYNLNDFKHDVLLHLKKTYGDAVLPGDRAIKIKANASRRNTDVIVCINFRKYIKFINANDQLYEEGICFYDSSNTQIINYPKMHLAHLTAKHKNTNGWFKPVVRIFKNLRSKLVQDGMIDISSAPSYFLEGMLYNVPNENFAISYGSTVVNSLNWLCNTDHSQLICANEQFYLLNDYSPVTWRAAKLTAFLESACNLWQQW